MNQSGFLGHSCSPGSQSLIRIEALVVVDVNAVVVCLVESSLPGSGSRIEVLVVVDVNAIVGVWLVESCSPAVFAVGLVVAWTKVVACATLWCVQNVLGKGGDI